MREGVVTRLVRNPQRVGVILYMYLMSLISLPNISKRVRYEHYARAPARARTYACIMMMISLYNPPRSDK